MSIGRHCAQLCVGCLRVAKVVRVGFKSGALLALTLPPLILVKTMERTEVMSFTANGVLVRNFDADGAAHFYRYLFN